MNLSIIIPAYNEEKRLPPALERTMDLLMRDLKEPFEVMVIDDGSKDATGRSVEAFTDKYPVLRLVRLPQNKGRGIAVAHGVEIAQGDLILEMDADGSVDSEAIPRFVDYMNTHPAADFVIGSRNIEGARIARPQTLLRTLLGNVFFVLAGILFGWDLRDRVNGFKMFRKQVAKDIFSYQHETGFLAEAEIVIIAERRGWKYELLPVVWTDYRDSRIHPFKESWRSFWGMFKILQRDRSGVYDRKNSLHISP